MWVHFLLLGLLLATITIQMTIAPNSKKQKIVLTLVFLVFFVFITFRAYTVGNDTYAYFRLFNLVNTQNSIFNASNISRYEVGYIALNYFIGKITNNFTFMIGVITTFYLSSSLYIVKRYARSVSVACILMFTLSLFYFAMSAERQCVAMSIFYLSIPLLEKRKSLSYSLMIVLASLFHITSIVLVVLAFLPEINFEHKKIFRHWVIMSLMGLIVLNYGMGIILRFFPYFEHYYTNSIYSEGGIRSASMALFCIRMFIMFLVKIIGGFKYQRYASSENIYIFNKLMFFDVVVTAASIGFNLLDRFERYFTLGFIIAIVNALYSLGKSRYERINKIIAEIMIISLTFLYITITLTYRGYWFGIFPYSFI